MTDEIARDGVTKATRVICRATKLPPEHAITSVYYAVATYRQEDFEWFPTLVFEGPQATGKSVNLAIQRRICCKPFLVSGKGITVPALRDTLEEAYEGTAIIEEVDECQNLKAVEELIGARCSRSTSVLSVKRQGRQGWEQQPINIFGATVLHRRQPFVDAAMETRAIVIVTRRRKGPFGTADISPDILTGIRRASLSIDPGGRPRVAEGLEGRVTDTWRPLLLVAEGLGDEDWLGWIQGHMHERSESLRDGQSYEPSAVVLGKLLEITLANPGKEFGEGRIAIDAEIGEPLRRQGYPWLTPWTVSEILRNQLGFGGRMHRSGGILWLYPTLDLVKQAADLIGYEDDALSGLNDSE